MNSRRHSTRSPARPLDSKQLQDLALRYVGKYATSRAKLGAYLTRKIRERGWGDEQAPDVTGIADRFAELGYIDDAAFALAQSRALSSRGYGKRRLTQKLRVTGIEECDRAAATDHADANAAEAALRFAERRRIGPFANGPADLVQREKWIAAMIRAGHGFAVAKALTSMACGAEIDPDQLRELTERT